jgi:hypothetical protein
MPDWPADGLRHFIEFAPDNKAAFLKTEQGEEASSPDAIAHTTRSLQELHGAGRSLLR